MFISDKSGLINIFQDSFDKNLDAQKKRFHTCYDTYCGGRGGRGICVGSSVNFK